MISDPGHVILAIGSGDRKLPLRLFGKFVFYVGYRDRTAKTLASNSRTLIDNEEHLH